MKAEPILSFVPAWLLGEVPHTTKTDYSTGWPDMFLGFPFWKPDRFHDFAYRKRPIPGYGKITSRVQADCWNYKAVRRMVNEYSLGPLHWFLGQILGLVHYIGIVLFAWPAWYKRRL